MAAVMLEAYDRVVDQMRPGRTDRDVVEAGRVITDAGYIWLSPLIHGAEGGSAGALPIIGSSVRQVEAEPFEFKPNMVVCVEIHVGKPDHSAGLFMADAWVTTEGEPRCLNLYRRDVIRI
jgi:hypothetical protein